MKDHFTGCFSLYIFSLAIFDNVLRDCKRELLQPYAHRMFDISLRDIVKREILEPYAHRMFDISLGDIIKRFEPHAHRMFDISMSIILVCNVVSSVRSSNSHPDLLVIQQQHQPLFQITPVLNTGLSLSEPLQLYQGQSLDLSADS